MEWTTLSGGASSRQVPCTLSNSLNASQRSVFLGDCSQIRAVSTAHNQCRPYRIRHALTGRVGAGFRARRSRH